MRHEPLWNLFSWFALVILRLHVDDKMRRRKCFSSPFQMIRNICYCTIVTFLDSPRLTFFSRPRPPVVYRNVLYGSLHITWVCCVLCAACVMCSIDIEFGVWKYFRFTIQPYPHSWITIFVSKNIDAVDVHNHNIQFWLKSIWIYSLCFTLYTKFAPMVRTFKLNEQQPVFRFISQL